MVQPLVGWVYEVTTSTDWVEKEKVKKKASKKYMKTKRVYPPTIIMDLIILNGGSKELRRLGLLSYVQHVTI